MELFSSEEEMTYGKIAYEAYCKTTDYKSLVTGDAPPQFGALRVEIQQAWEAAGVAVAKAVLDSCLHG